MVLVKTDGKRAVRAALARRRLPVLGNSGMPGRYVRTLRRLALRALALAGRLPWLALVCPRCGLAMSRTPPRSIGQACAACRGTLVWNPPTYHARPRLKRRSWEPASSQKSPRRRIPCIRRRSAARLQRRGLVAPGSSTRATRLERLLARWLSAPRLRHSLARWLFPYPSGRAVRMRARSTFPVAARALARPSTP